MNAAAEPLAPALAPRGVDRTFLALLAASLAVHATIALPSLLQWPSPAHEAPREIPVELVQAPPEKPAPAKPPEPDKVAPKDVKKAPTEEAKPAPEAKKAPAQEAKTPPAKDATKAPAKSSPVKPSPVKPASAKQASAKPASTKAAAKPPAKAAANPAPARSLAQRQAEPPKAPEPPKTLEPPKPAQIPQQAADPGPTPQQAATQQRMSALLGGMAAIAVPGASAVGEDALPYDQIVLSQVAKAKKEGSYPGVPGATTVAFLIGDKGEVATCVVLHPSGDANLDAEAVAMVHRGEPYPPPPPGGRRDYVITLEFKAT